MGMTQYIVSTTCDICNERGRKCAVFLNTVDAVKSPAICGDCLKATNLVLTHIHRNVTTLEDLA